MTSEHTSDDHYQEFRILSTSSSASASDNTVFIPSWLDKKTGERIVLWRDIQNEVGDAHRVRNGKRSVTFMMDDDFNELQPKRIRYNPGAVLDVVLASQDQDSVVAPDASMPSRTSVQGSTPSLPSAGPKNPLHQTGCSGKIASVVQHVSQLSIANLDAVDRSLIAQSAILDNEEQTSLQQDDLPNGILGTANISMQDIEIPTVDDYIKGLFGGMKTTGIQEGNLFQLHTLRLLQQTLSKQQQTLNRQVNLENRVQALMTQNYELHEYPIPRLFIVLPKPKKRRDKIAHPLTKQFRLYFLCECGEHTKGASRSNLPNKIHLAKHDGYDLEQPNEFFKKYGSYVLALLKFLKYGTMAAGIAVPPLALFKVVEGLDAIQKSLTMTTDAIGSLINQTIKHIQDLQGNTQDNGNATTGHMGLEDIEALEGADLRQLQLFLNDKDKGRVLGDLFRISTPDGHVKWVCIDHHEEYHRKAAMKRLAEIISANGGERTGDESVRISFGSDTEATQFYEAMAKARGVQSLDIALEWEATMDDLQRLSSAVTKANISRLDLQVTPKILEGSVLDVINKSRRQNPVLELMCNGRIQEMKLWDFGDFYERIDVSSITAPSQLQKLSLPLYTRTEKSSLAKFLERCPFLVELELEVSDFNEAFEDVTTDLTGLPHFKSFTMNMRLRRIVVEISQCKIQSMNAFLRIDCIWDRPWLSLESLFRKGHLTELTAGSTSSQHVSKLANTIQWNPRLRNIEFRCPMEDSEAIMDAITSMRGGVLLEQGYFEPLRVSLSTSSKGVGGLSVDFEFRDESTASIALHQDMRQPTLINPHMLSALFMKYGQFIKVLRTNDGFNDELAEILNRVTQVRGSRITLIRLDAAPLTNVGLECMMKVIERSQDLQRLDVTFQELGMKCQQKKLKPFLRRCGKKLHGLRMEGDSAGVWIPKVMDICPTRRDLPELESFGLVTNEGTQLAMGCMQWIVNMVSSPSPVQPTCSLEPSTPSAMSSTSGTSAHGWNPLHSIELKHIYSHVAGWEWVLVSIDYSGLRKLHVEDRFSINDMSVLQSRIPLNSNPVGELDSSVVTTIPLFGTGDVFAEVRQVWETTQSKK